MNNKIYPLHSSLRAPLKNLDSVVLAHNLLLSLSHRLNLQYIDLLIVITLASSKEPLAFNDLSDLLPSFTKDQLKRRVNELSFDKIIHADPYIADDHGFTYEIPIVTKELLSQITRSDLLEVREYEVFNFKPATASPDLSGFDQEHDVVEDIISQTPPVSCGWFTRFMNWIRGR